MIQEAAILRFAAVLKAVNIMKNKGQMNRVLVKIGARISVWFLLLR